MLSVQKNLNAIFSLVVIVQEGCVCTTMATQWIKVTSEIYGQPEICSSNCDG